MSVPSSFIDDLLSRTDLVGLIGRYVKLEQSGKQFKGLCPFHDEKTPSFQVIPDKQFFHCFGCGASGDAISFLRRHENLDFIPALKELARIQGIDLPENSSSSRETAEQKDVRHKSLALLQQAADYYHSMLNTHQFADKARLYLKRRGLGASIVKRFYIGFAPPERNGLFRLWRNDPEKLKIAKELGLIKQSSSAEQYDQFRDRIIFPIRDTRGRVRGFGGRAIGDNQQPKYLNSSESTMFHKASLLYGLYESLEQRSKEGWLIVEGYMDVIALHQKGFERVVACLGTAINKQQIQWLGRYQNRLCFAFDGDNAGKRAAEKTMHTCLSLVSDESEYSFAFLPNGEDPDSIVSNHGAQALQKLVGSQSVPLSAMFIRWMQQQGNLATVEGKAKIASLANKELAKVPNGYFKKLLENQIREITGTSYYRSYKGRANVPSVKDNKLSVESKTLLLHFLAAVFNNTRAFIESSPPLIEQIRLLAPYAEDLPLDFFERVVSEPDGELLMLMMETLDHEQIESVQNYHKNTNESPGADDMNRLFVLVRKHYYGTMNDEQKIAYMDSLSLAVNSA